MIGALVFLVIFGYFSFTIMADIIGFIGYCRAEVYEGTILSSLGTERVRDYFAAVAYVYIRSTWFNG